MARLNNLRIDNAKIGWKNFSGKEKEYNVEGKRNFCVFFEDLETVENLRHDGWNVKSWVNKNREEIFYMPVQVKYPYAGVDDNGNPFTPIFPPPIVFISCGDKEVSIDETSISMLDWADMINIKLSIRPYFWKKGNRSGISADLRSLRAEIDPEDMYLFEKMIKKNNQDLDDEVPFE